MTIIAVLDLMLTPDAAASAPALIRDVLIGTRGFDGCLGVEVLFDTADANHVILIERWASPEADAAYREWRAGDGASNLGTILAGAPTLTRFQSSSEEI